ncbi:hypothetical protein HMPREF0063_12464 [Aeromicrobium marinum DSM 15272]|uniref:Ferredoxin n=1 Tax=Aeromicrobium marinum DSM 15272 TaxID=585531 RepID=E2SEK5_9ACTN|nr:hypothetical protein [Aeromicrobium marinum]EFQ82302.1 hypothetical protein HMPREF0063_12464 [Aeromicrobium marinum DSM 15272]
MAYIVPLHAETLEDRALYTRARLAEVACLDCTARVLVRKNSEHHTSIQWSREAVAACATFDRLAAQAGGRPVHAECPRLAASIEAAARDGALPVGSPDE